MTGGAEGRWIVDRRTEGGAAVHAEDGRIFELPSILLPEGLREGDHIIVRREDASPEGVRLQLRRDDAAAERGRVEARSRIERLRERDPGGRRTL